MERKIVPFLIMFPLLTAGLVYTIRNEKIRKIIALVSPFCSMAAVGMLTLKWIKHSCGILRPFNSLPVLDYVIAAAELILMAIVVFYGVRYKKKGIAVLAILQGAGMALTGFLHKGSLYYGISIGANMGYIDRLTILLCVITGGVGGLVLIYAVGYIKNYYERNKKLENHSNYFLAILFVMQAAMFGTIFMHNLIWIHFFWTLLVIAAFLLIGYTREEDAIGDAFRMLGFNLSGNTLFALGIVLFAFGRNQMSFQSLVEIPGLEKAGFFAGTPSYATIAFLLTAVAALTAAAQFPASRWLLKCKEMLPPTAIYIESVALANVGVYLLFRLIPGMDESPAGTMVALLGGFTFLVTAVMSVTQRELRKMLDRSTVSYMGMMVFCAGVGTPEMAWIGAFLMMFHTVAKSLLLQVFETAENTLHSCDQNALRGLVYRAPRMGVFMYIGIAGMVLAPLGVLIAKGGSIWKNTGISNGLPILLVIIGTVITVFSWIRWLLPLSAYVPVEETIKEARRFTRAFSMLMHTIMLVGLCVMIPVLSGYFVDPMVEELYGLCEGTSLTNAVKVLLFLLALAIVIPLVSYIVTRKSTAGQEAGASTADAPAAQAKKPFFVFLDNLGQGKYMVHTQILALAMLVIGSVIVIIGSLMG